jgi:hypothetical protein
MPQSPAHDADEYPNGIAVYAGRTRCSGNEVSEVSFIVGEPIRARCLPVECFEPGEPLEVSKTDVSQVRWFKDFPAVCLANTSLGQRAAYLLRGRIQASAHPAPEQRWGLRETALSVRKPHSLVG